MNILEISEKQIRDQIEGKTVLEIDFLELKGEREVVELYEQIIDEKHYYYLRPLFSRAIRISVTEYEEILRKYGDTDEQIGYDEFFNRYYNKDPEVCSLQEYIDRFYRGNNSEFARSQNVNRKQVNEWLSKDWIVMNDKLYSSRRELNPIHSWGQYYVLK